MARTNCSEKPGNTRARRYRAGRHASRRLGNIKRQSQSKDRDARLSLRAATLTLKSARAP